MKNATIIAMTLATLLTTTLMAGNAAAAQQCGARVAVTGAGAVGAFYGARKRRAEKRGKRAWRNFVNGGVMFYSATGGSPSKGLGTRYSDLDNAKNVVINCKGYPMRCTITATPCTK